MLRAFESGLIRLDKILDLACGTNHPGYMAIAAIEEVGQVIALDNDKALLYNPCKRLTSPSSDGSDLGGAMSEKGLPVLISRSHRPLAGWSIHNGMSHPKVYKLIDDATNTKFNKEVFDAIACVSALEHMSYRKECIKEMHRLLKPGGMAFVTVDISTDWTKTIKHDVDVKPPSYYAREFERAGLKIFGDYNDHLPDDAVDTICSKYPLAASESELLDGQHNALKTFKMVLRKRE